MMNIDPILYYRTLFVDEYIKMRDNDNFDRITMASISPDKWISRDRQAYTFQKFPIKHLFLYCYFFQTLFDQATHSFHIDIHSYYNRMIMPLKFNGILSISNVNLHPGYLILMATLYIDNKDEKSLAKTQFKKLTEFFLNDYGDLILNKYSMMTGALKQYQYRKKFFIGLLGVMKDGVKSSSRPKEYSLIQTFTNLKSDYLFYSKMMDYLTTKIDDKIFELQTSEWQT